MDTQIFAIPILTKQKTLNPCSNLKIKEKSKEEPAAYF